jgi:hypothetical protein
MAKPQLPISNPLYISKIPALFVNLPLPSFPTHRRFRLPRLFLLSLPLALPAQNIIIRYRLFVKARFLATNLANRLAYRVPGKRLAQVRHVAGTGLTRDEVFGLTEILFGWAVSIEQAGNVQAKSGQDHCCFTFVKQSDRPIWAYNLDRALLGINPDLQNPVGLVQHPLPLNLVVLIVGRDDFEGYVRRK